MPKNCMTHYLEQLMIPLVTFPNYFTLVKKLRVVREFNANTNGVNNIIIRRRFSVCKDNWCKWCTILQLKTAHHHLLRASLLIPPN